MLLCRRGIEPRRGFWGIPQGVLMAGGGGGVGTPSACYPMIQLEQRLAFSVVYRRLPRVGRDAQRRRSERGERGSRGGDPAGSYPCRVRSAWCAFSTSALPSCLSGPPNHVTVSPLRTVCAATPGIVQICFLSELVNPNALESGIETLETRLFTWCVTSMPASVYRRVTVVLNPTRIRRMQGRAAGK